jgi:hypothetical protein
MALEEIGEIGDESRMKEALEIAVAALGEVQGAAMKSLRSLAYWDQESSKRRGKFENRGVSGSKRPRDESA